mmetsp:Transcript_14127/g.15627  ORF Transcript_14127/g.15627 Transcript_14127/m.15627 type:complete len:228 (+) Transcript_14127:122-805(+)|eukprot:CAMPEP_0168521148 /NCGR_PEP_ID=MMETSP0405-20121227/8479_1 /TAXON_ID=498012 /ORGANISM="Trichosphaerium sp, Strain Am-I-7 wt" /LENGTH=227 /DNA_ID=CAMNT_0008542303 /DNA_START=55 /DNA_END=738 /DNA_ORIENTATION=-
MWGSTIGYTQSPSRKRKLPFECEQAVKRPANIENTSRLFQARDKPIQWSNIPRRVPCASNTRKRKFVPLSPLTSKRRRRAVAPAVPTPLVNQPVACKAIPTEVAYSAKSQHYSLMSPKSATQTLLRTVPITQNLLRPDGDVHFTFSDSVAELLAPRLDGSARQYHVPELFDPYKQALVVYEDPNKMINDFKAKAREQNFDEQQMNTTYLDTEMYEEQQDSENEMDID